MTKELKKILFVDDDEDIHLIVTITLRDIPGVEVRSAFSGEEAIKMVMEFKPDLIVLDVMMPKMDGIATLQALHLLPSYSNTPVIFLTGKTQKNEVEDYFKSGILDVIIKPFDPSTFAAKIQQLWDKYQKEQSKLNK